MKVMDKRIIVSLPATLHDELKKAASSRYQSIAGYIRASLLEKIQNEQGNRQSNRKESK